MKETTKAVLSSIFLIVASQNAWAQTVCNDIDKVIDEGILSIALAEAQGAASDRSAPQQTSRYLEINNQLQVININMAIRSQNSCPPREAPINPLRYKTQALDCVLAQLQRVDVATKCDFKTWKLE